MSLKLFVLPMVVALSLSVGACQKKEVKPSTKTEPVSKQVVVVKPTLENLDKRVTAVEDRLNKARAARGQFTPAPKYNPNFKG